MSHEVARHWRSREQRLRLVGEVCHNVGCGEKIFPPRDVCPHCNQYANVEYKFSGKGTVYSYTIVDSEPPAGFEKFTPYVVALVKLEEGPMITAQLTDVENWVEKRVNGSSKLMREFDVKIGMPVEMVTRKLSEDGDRGLIQYAYKFRPVLNFEVDKPISIPLEEELVLG
jgi:uncharacterized OB-fold protein